MNNKEYLIERLKKAKIEISDQQCSQLLKYYELLVERNKVMNLTAITECKEVVDKHFVDSLALIALFGGQNETKEAVMGKTLIDLGTGAGFPGIPLKIVFPDLNVVLLDSLNKRIVFLNDVISELELKNIDAFHGRAEEFGRQKAYREQFDFCVSRAVANLSTLSEYCLPFVKVGGSFIAYKSGKIDQEVNESQKAVRVMGGNLIEVKSFVLPQTDIERTLVHINKVELTPKVYPRKAGKPAKEPIKC